MPYFPPPELAPTGAGPSSRPVLPNLLPPESAPSWVGDDDNFRALLVPLADLQHLQCTTSSMSMGEILDSHVIHVNYRAHEGIKITLCNSMHAPDTTSHHSHADNDNGDNYDSSNIHRVFQRFHRLSTQSADPPAPISSETHELVLSLSKELVVSIFFSKDVLVSLTADKKCIVKRIICEVRPKIPALCVATRWTADDDNIEIIWLSVTIFRTAFTTIIRQAIVMGYSLFPPQGSGIPPDTFHIVQVQCLIVDNPLVFMHQYSFAADSTLVIHTKYNNLFILHVLSNVIWCSTFKLHMFLEESPHCQLHYAISAASAITESVLLEQGIPQLAKGSRISPKMTLPTFTKIIKHLDQLTEAERAVLDKFMDNMVMCGRLQQDNEELFDFAFE
ncbi:hypothetical protein BDR07DRAFT_1491730 [Suillus spraguei]|nr:hypothetical protein BDR07DRAFT_1491730 [Suillus spraguei]